MKQFEEDMPESNQNETLSVLILGLASTLVLSSLVVTCVMNWFVYS